MTRDLLNTDWKVLDMWLFLHSKPLSLIDKYVPTQMFAPNSKTRPKWLSPSAFKAIKQKHKPWNTYKATRCQSDYVSYATKRNITTSTVGGAKSDFEFKLVDSVKQNSDHLCFEIC